MDTDNSETKPTIYLKLPANRGAYWIRDAYLRFRHSMGIWFAISAFLMVILSIPYINHLAAIAMPILLGGLMIGCSQSSSKEPIKFDHLFEGIKNDARELLVLSAIYAGLSVLIAIATYYFMLALGVDIKEMMAGIMPSQQTAMSEQETLDWINGLVEQNIFINILLAMLIWLALMIPLLMAFWFAPALVVLQKLNAVSALKISYSACKENFIPFLIYGLVALAYIFAFFIGCIILIAIIPPIGILAFIAGYLAIFAITLISIYSAYIEIFGEQDNENLSGDESNDSDSSMIA